MDLEHRHLLINRAIDGVASATERDELARAIKADPLLRSEFDDQEAAHVATGSLFRQLSLPEDFSKRVMRRIQGLEVPSDEAAEAVRLPSQRPLQGRKAKVISIHRRRARVYAVVAFVSAAAALILALGVITGAFAGTGTSKTQDKTAAEGRQGVPDTESPKPHRDSHPQPLPSEDRTAPKGDAVADPEPESSKDPQPGPKNDEPAKGETKQPEGDNPVGPDQPKAEPTPDDVVDSGPTPEPVPDDVVEAQPDPTKEPEGTDSGSRVEIGRMLVLSGQVDMVAADGTLTRLGNDQAIRDGDRIRTKFNALVMLQLSNGDVTLGKETEVSLTADGNVRLENCNGKEKGTIAVDRNSAHEGSAMEVYCNDYTLLVMSGVAVLERKRDGMNVSKAVGLASLTHNELGSIVLPEESGYEAEVVFGKAYAEPDARSVLLPTWSGKARAHAVMLAINDALSERQFAEKQERTWVVSRLPGKLDSLMTYPTTTDSIVDFLGETILSEQFNGVAIVKMVGEVENAFIEINELSPEVISHHALRAAMVAQDYEQWLDYFYRLMRPPVEPKNPKNPVTAPANDPVPECPNSKKFKRIAQPPRKTVKPAKPDNGEEPAETPEEDANG